ncbi:hypothetical protein WMY93_005353 [Mugilogobius chulae]|uniref:Uncharacterized protein n=1 Tax=Mugilogobius chulae TaxID=88201 RepID=A0AAW0PQT2_9GOBI
MSAMLFICTAGGERIAEQVRVRVQSDTEERWLAGVEFLKMYNLLWLPTICKTKLETRSEVTFFVKINKVNDGVTFSRNRFDMKCRQAGGKEPVVRQAHT